MDNASLVDRLKARVGSEWHPRRAAAAARDIEDLERNLGYRLPDEFRELLLYSNGGSVEGSGTSMNLQSVQDTSSQRYNESFARMPSMLVIADDGGGNVYFYDPSNVLGNGPFAVHLASMSAFRPERSMLVGHNLRETVDAILGGEDLTERLD